MECMVKQNVQNEKTLHSLFKEIFQPELIECLFDAEL